jgi:hypothetical protein
VKGFTVVLILKLMPKVIVNIAIIPRRVIESNVLFCLKFLHTNFAADIIGLARCLASGQDLVQTAFGMTYSMYSKCGNYICRNVLGTV